MIPNSAIPAIKRLVAIGRRIKVSDMFTPGPPLAPLSAASASPSSAAVLHRNLTARSQPQLTFGDHDFTRIHAFDHHVLLHASARGYVARFHRAVRLHH